MATCTVPAANAARNDTFPMPVDEVAGLWKANRDEMDGRAVQNFRRVPSLESQPAGRR